jgi:LysR family glycine cleavage system transcriptional activator
MTRAADELGVTQSAVSHQVSKLERILGSELFNRHATTVSLTKMGTAYFSAVHAPLSQLYSRHTNFVREHETYTLKIKLPPTVAMRWLIPRLPRFHARYPLLATQIVTSHTQEDPYKDDVDIEIWSVSNSTATARSTRLFGETIVPVCSPRLIEGHSLVKPADLCKFVLLYSMQRREDWELWFSAVGESLGEHPSIGFENSVLAYQSAVDSVGIAIAQLRMVRDDMLAGRLVLPFPMPVQSGRAYYLTSVGNPAVHKVQCFRDWLLKEIAEDPEDDA